MAIKRVLFTFPRELIKEPVIYRLSHNFKIITNIRRADVTDDRGWAIIELEGEEKEIDAGIDWVKSLGIRVDPVIGDVVEG